MNDEITDENELCEKAIAMYRATRQYYTNVDIEETDVKKLREAIQYIINSAELLLKRLKML